jgi:hypothetical protein
MLTTSEPTTSRPMSEDLRSILDEAGGQSMTVAEIERVLKGRGYALLALFLTAPFLVPNIPGLSVPFGLAVAAIGASFAMAKKPWLPEFVLKTTIQYSLLQKTIPHIAGVIERIERMMKPRFQWIEHGPVMGRLIGISIVSGGFFLSLPLPIPFTNGFPALSIILLVLGMIGRDGLAVLCGHFLMAFSWFYLFICLLVGKSLLLWLAPHIPWFGPWLQKMAG